MVEPKGPVLLCAGREFHVRVWAGDEPAVVLMSGCGLAMEYWREVGRAFEGRRVIAYDRPGMGGTRWPGRLPTLAEEVASLVDLLDQLGMHDVVLVAHSMAAFHAEALARTRPGLVAGMVLVDGSVEDYERKPSTVLDALPECLRGLVRHRIVSRLGGYLWRFGTWVQSDWDFRRLGRGRIGAIYRDPESLLMATAESIAYYRQAWDLQQLRLERPWPGPATILLTAGTRRSWLARQAALADLLDARQVVVEHSRHLMMLDRPHVIVEAVESLSSRRD